GKQLALIGAAGLSVNTALTQPAAGNVNLLLAAVGAPVTVAAAVSNTGTGPTTLVSCGDNVAVNALVSGAATDTMTVWSSGGAVTDGNGIGVTNVSGGPVVLNADAPTGINLDVLTTRLTATTSNDPITVRGQAGSDLPVASVNAGTGDVSLSVNNGNLTDLNPNDLVADVVGNTVTLSVFGTGTIGTGTATAMEINATTLSASTNNQNLWITDTAGGVA